METPLNSDGREASKSMETRDADESRGESSLVALARSGDEHAFGELVQMYYSRIYGLLYGMVRNPEDARDLAQQTWVKAWNNLRGFRTGSRFYTWVYRIAVNTALDFNRSKARRREESLTLADDENAGRERDLVAGADWRPDRQVELDEINAAFREALDTLSPEHRSALVLRELRGLSYKEIAKLMKCRTGTVMSRL